MPHSPGPETTPSHWEMRCVAGRELREVGRGVEVVLQPTTTHNTPCTGT